MKRALYFVFVFLLLLSFGLLLSGCQMRAGPDVAVSFCSAGRAIHWSSKDTLETIKQIKGHNAAGKALGCKGPYWTPSFK